MNTANPVHDRDTIRLAARQVVCNLLGAEVADNDSLISSGRIDSLSILGLIAALERELKVCIPPANLQPDDLESIEWIVDTVERAAISK